MRIISIVDWFLGLFGWGVAIEYSEGWQFCEHCRNVYDKEEDHRCVYTGHCMDCKKRRPLAGGVCLSCGGRSIALVRRGF